MTLEFIDRDFKETDLRRILDFLNGMGKYPNSNSDRIKTNYWVSLTNNQFKRFINFLADYNILTLNDFLNKEKNKINELNEISDPEVKLSDLFEPKVKELKVSLDENNRPEII